MEKIENYLQNLDFQRLSEIRRHLHRNPEISLEETNTRNFVKAQLSEVKGLLLKNIGGMGLIATLDTQKPGPTILFRAELDALPIAEINTFEHTSQNAGKGHLCGHDGHTIILIGLAKLLAQSPPNCGKVHLLFQPAEEIGEGAKAVLADTAFIDFEPDYVYALHNIPGYPIHSIIVKNDAFTASVKSLILRIKGKTSHAAEPENGINPSYFLAQVLSELPSLMQDDIYQNNFRIISPTHGMFGDDFAYGTSAGYGELRLTIRTWTNDIMNKLESDLIHFINTLGDEMKVTVEKEWTQIFAANENHKDAMYCLRKVLKEQKHECIERTIPFKWGEDFGLFTQKYKGAMFGLGAGKNCPALHNPDYDFPDELLKTGISIFAGLAYNHLI